jgi:carbon monoxide dehydrogenase subunit G
MARFSTEYRERFRVPASLERTRAALSDVREIATRLEDVRSVDAEDGNVLRVAMKPINRGPVTFRGEYRCRYTVPAPDHVVWEPTGRDGNMWMRGEARLKSVDGVTEVDFVHAIEAEIEINWLLSAVATPIVNSMMQRGVQRFVEQTRHALGDAST